MLDYTLEIWVQDRRCSSGERLRGTYRYKGVSGNWMQEEMRELRRQLYPESKYRMVLRDTVEVDTEHN